MIDRPKNINKNREFTLIFRTFKGVFMKKGLTFETLIGFDDLQKEFDLVFNEHRELIKLIIGDNYGIVSQTNVTEYSPLFPTLENNILHVTEGKVVTKNGDVTKVDEFSKEINSFSNDLAILFVYEMVGSFEKRVTNDGNAAPIWYERKDTDSSILVIKASEYNLLSNDIKDNSICICVVKYSDTPYIDLTNQEYSFNRPWFSPTDISHRLEKGTGNSDVPHSIGINDLASSNVTLYNQLLSRGMIVSKDVSIAGISGKSEEIEINVSNISDNEVSLNDCYPNAIGYCSTHEHGEGFNDVPAYLIEGTNKIKIPNPPTSEKLYINAVCTKCLMINDSLDLITNELTFKENENNDILITEGKQTELVGNSISFANCGTLPKTYEVVFGADGKLHKEPDVLGFSSLLSSISNTYNQEYSVPVRVQVVLQNNDVDENANYSILIKVSGVNENGESVNEELEWSNEEGTITLKDITEKYYKKITSIELIENIGTLSTCKATVFAIANYALDNRLRVALVEWNKDNSNYGSISSIKDIRPIATTLRDPFDLSVIKETGKAIANSNFLNSLYNNLPYNEILIIEDFRKVAYLNSQCVNWKLTPYGINYPIINENISDSRSIANCYRSRRIYDNISNHKYAVILIDSDYETSHSKSVRIGTYDLNEEYNEYPMLPSVDDNRNIIGNGMFLLYIKDDIKDIQIIVSGKSAGFILLKLNDVDDNSYYEVRK